MDHPNERMHVGVEMTPARACETIRLEFGAAIKEISKLAKTNGEIAQNAYAHIEAALEARVYRLCQLAEQRGIRHGRIAERQDMVKAAGADLRRGKESGRARIARRQAEAEAVPV